MTLPLQTCIYGFTNLLLLFSIVREASRFKYTETVLKRNEVKAVIVESLEMKTLAAVVVVVVVV